MWCQVRFSLRMENEAHEYRGIGEFMFNEIEKTYIPIRVICGCCGVEFEAEEVKIIEIYEDWVNIQDAIAKRISEPAPIATSTKYVMSEAEKRAWFFCG